MYSFAAGLDYRINDAFSLSNATRYYHYDLDRNNTLADASPTRFVTAPNGELLIKLNRGNVARDEYGIFNQTELKQQGELAGMQHSLLYGVELGHQDKFQRNFSQNKVARVPVFRDALVAVPERASTLSAKGTNFQDTAGFYVQDLVELSEQWEALLGVRYDIFGQEYDDDRVASVASVANVANVDLDRTDKNLEPARRPGLPAGSGAVLLRLGQPRLAAVR